MSIRFEPGIIHEDVCVQEQDRLWFQALDGSHKILRRLHNSHL